MNILNSFTEHFKETHVRSTLPAQKDVLLNILISFALEAYWRSQSDSLLNTLIRLVLEAY